MFGQDLILACMVGVVVPVTFFLVEMTYLWIRERLDIRRMRKLAKRLSSRGE